MTWTPRPEKAFRYTGDSRQRLALAGLHLSEAALRRTMPWIICQVVVGVGDGGDVAGRVTPVLAARLSRGVEHGHGAAGQGRGCARG